MKLFSIRARRDNSYHVSHFKRSTRYLLVALLPLILCWLLIINQSREWSMTLVKTNTDSALEKNAMLIDQRFTALNQSLLSLKNDSFFNEMLSRIDPSSSDYRDDIRDLNAITGQYFWDFDSFCSFMIVSDRFSDSYMNQSALPNSIFPKEIVPLQDIRSANGKTIWFPTRHMSEIIHINDRYSKYYSDFDVLTLAVQTDMSYVTRGVIHHAPSDERPILLITLFSTIFDQWLTGHDGMSSTLYRIYTNDGEPVYASEGLSWEHVDDCLLPRAEQLRGRENYNFFSSSGIQGTYVSSRQLESTEWIITAYTPMDNTFLYFSSSISVVSLIVILLTIFLVLIVVRVTMRSISQPLTLLCDGLHQTAEGNYAHRITETKYSSYQTAFGAYNDMNSHIAKLIAENYEIKLSEKELEIQLINLQFNPHFLYNMLNTISLLALENGHDLISDMLCKLGYMMRYSVKTPSPIVPFGDELHYIETYISAMRLRASNRFTYKSGIDEELLHHPVPKFMLQPFVENAILHGFAVESEGAPYQLTVTARRDGSDLLFTVEDNGVGMNQEMVQTLWHRKSTHIGIANTNKRIQLYYGSEYGVSIEATPGVGTRVSIRIPAQAPNTP